MVTSYGLIYCEPLNHYLVLSSKKPVIAEINDNGDLLKLVALPKKLHRPPEGIAITAHRELIIANEGGKGEGYLVSYAPVDRCFAGSDVSNSTIELTR